jgi:hypothetical protein
MRSSVFQEAEAEVSYADPHRGGYEGMRDLRQGLHPLVRAQQSS